MTAKFEVCLLAPRVNECLPQVRALLEPADALPYEVLDCVDASYCDVSQGLTLRLAFSRAIRSAEIRNRLVTYLRELGLVLVIPEWLEPFERVRFENQLRDQVGFRVRRSPTAENPSVLPEIIDRLEEHLERAGSIRERRFTTELDPLPRASTLDALDLLISDLPVPQTLASGSSESIAIVTGEDAARSGAGDDLPIRMETFGALDDMIANLPERPRTHDALRDMPDDR